MRALRGQAGGALIGPHALGIVKDVEGVRHLAELGVVFLLFNIGLELSLDRLRSMQKFVFGLGSAQARSHTSTFSAVSCSISSLRAAAIQTGFGIGAGRAAQRLFT